MKKLLLLALLSISGLTFANGVDINPNSGNLPASPGEGECYLHDWKAPTYLTKQVDVVVKDGYRQQEATQPEWETLQKEVVIKDAYNTYEVTDATFVDGSTTVVIKSGSIWELGVCGNEREVACYKDVTETTMVPTLNLLKDGFYTVKNHPAVTQTITYQALLTPADVSEVIIAPLVNRLDVETVVSPGEMEWLIGGCAGIGIKNVQQELNKIGYDAGPVDGILGTKTKDAITKFRLDNNIESDEFINDELLTKLGLK